MDTKVARPVAARSAAAGSVPSRARFGLAIDVQNPSVGGVYVVPFLHTDYNDGDVVMNQDNTLTVITGGLYRASISSRWQDRADGQVDLRIVGVGHGKGGQKPGTWVPGQLTKITVTFDRLCQQDVVATNTPKTARAQAAWTPGRLARGQTASVDVRVAPAGVVTLGDVAFAAHTGIDDARQGAKKVATLIVHAKVVGPDTVRVSIHNPGVADVAIPQGALRVLAMSATGVAGDSGEGQVLLSSALEHLAPGDCVYGFFRSKALMDRLRGAPSTFLSIERWA